METMGMTPEERLVAEQAVLTLRLLKEAAARAPMGQGMNALEAVIHDQGKEHLRQMMSLAAASRPEAQKKVLLPIPGEMRPSHRTAKGSAVALCLRRQRSTGGCRWPKTTLSRYPAGGKGMR
jgi:hypothetical protein